MHDNYDVLIIGGGPGGYVAAIRAGQLGLRTALVEKQHLGGICLNWGCIPTKALLHGAEVAHSITHASQLGISVGEVNVDLQKLVQFSRAVSQQLTGGVEYLLKKNGVRVIDGTARLRGKGQITVADARGGSARLPGRSRDPGHGRPTTRITRHRARWRIYLDLLRGTTA